MFYVLCVAKGEESENYDDAKKYGKMYKNVIPLKPVIADEPESLGVEGVISPVDILLSPQQMMEEGYPLPIQGICTWFLFLKKVINWIMKEQFFKVRPPTDSPVI